MRLEIYLVVNICSRYTTSLLTYAKSRLKFQSQYLLLFLETRTFKKLKHFFFLPPIFEILLKIFYEKSSILAKHAYILCGYFITHFSKNVVSMDLAITFRASPVSCKSWLSLDKIRLNYLILIVSTQNAFSIWHDIVRIFLMWIFIITIYPHHKHQKSMQVITY